MLSRGLLYWAACIPSFQLLLILHRRVETWWLIWWRFLWHGDRHLYWVCEWFADAVLKVLIQSGEPALKTLHIFVVLMCLNVQLENPEFIQRILWIMSAEVVMGVFKTFRVDKRTDVLAVADESRVLIAVGGGRDILTAAVLRCQIDGWCFLRHFIREGLWGWSDCFGEIFNFLCQQKFIDLVIMLGVRCCRVLLD